MVSRLLVVLVVLATSSYTFSQDQRRIVFSDLTSQSKSPGSTSLGQIPIEIAAMEVIPAVGKNAHIALNNDGTFLVIGSDNGSVNIWDIGGDAPSQKLTLVVRSGLTIPAYMPGTVQVDIHPKFPTAGAVGSIGNEHPIRNAPGSNRLARIIWIIQNGKQSFLATGGAKIGRKELKEGASGFLFSPDGQFEAQFDLLRVFVTRKVDPSADKAEQRSQREVWSKEFEKDRSILGICWVGEYLAVLTDEKIIAWKPEVGGTKPWFLFPSKGAKAISGNGDLLIAVGPKTSLYNLSEKTTAELTSSCSSACFSLDSQFLFTATEAGEITLWNMQSGEALSVIKIGKTVTSMDAGMPKSGQYVLAVGTEDGGVHVFRILKK